MTPHDWDGRLVRYPAERAARYRASGAWSEQPTTARLHESALAHADRIALVTDEATYTYRELDERTDRIAAGLAALGLRPRDPVIFQVNNRGATILAWYGVLKAGLIPVATLSQHRRHEIGHISEKVGAVAHLVETGLSFDLVGFAREIGDGHPTLRHILTIGAPEGQPGTVRIEDLGTRIDAVEARALVESIEAGIAPEDVAVFQLSGGTTGVPKVIPRIHAEYWNNGRYYAGTFGWTEESRIAHLIPVIHNAGISCALHAAHSVGATLVLGTPDAVASFPLLERSGVTDVLIGHGHYQPAGSTAFDPVLKTVRRTVLSGAKVPPDLFAKLDDGDRHWAGQMFGMSEGMFIVTPLDAPEAARRATVGLPIAPDDEIAILDPNSEEPVATGEVGELCCRGPYTIPGYFGAPEHNATAFTADGFYRTGDLAALHEFDGRRYVAIEGRIKDLINRGGEKVNAEEVELLLLRHEGIAAAAVVAMPDERLGEKACAFVVAASGAELTMAEVQEHMDGLGVAKYKWPERLVWVSALPQTNVGKVNKKVMRADIIERLESEAREGERT
ncbi:(2,3-dihydroxybenzoyl)adenylate synthase [Tsukamurella pseudospumae]|uniref:2,3-dihydroxybenzoate-AMP ligase n=1 Tax=Tsukamurella pseudospumae TaxID=239498 RepID=A0A138A892_9ACTN|nr:AMP-binding protein [Tsukamurella pseudospumae]KXP06613.1 2,3-dihydroxybenzoate-AMP ligase [Tsukamurella pseudospumae]